MNITQDWSYALKTATTGMLGPQYTRVIDGNLYTIYKRRKDYLYYYTIQSERGVYIYRSESDMLFKGEVNPHKIMAIIESKVHVR